MQPSKGSFLFHKFPLRQEIWKMMAEQEAGWLIQGQSFVLSSAGIKRDTRELYFLQTKQNQGLYQ